MTENPGTFRLAFAVGCLAVVAGCSSLSIPGGPDLINSPAPGEVRAPTAERPKPDSLGVISYPNYQVAVARDGDTVQSIATRLGLNAQAMATTNGLPLDTQLNPGELVLLSSRVAASPTTGGAVTPGGSVDVAVLAGSALDRADGNTTTTTATPTTTAKTTTPGGVEPIRHKVLRGETAYSIARSYGISVRALADWNGLDSAMTVREGQILLIPPVTGPVPATADTTSVPGAGSVAPEPPSAAAPQPAKDLPSAAAATAAAATPAATAPISGSQTSASDNARLLQPVSGKIIRGYQPGKNEGLDFGAGAGAPVRAADSGVVAAITRDVDQVPILVIRHSGNLLTVYANVEEITVEKGQTVSRGQIIAKVRSTDPSYLHFEVRKGFDSVDPVLYLSN
ncbi:LysM peptidoglycan-binding domain-containing M23 family metallopeptidase [Pseudoruegeria sp. SK021]|uniref:LysM peptidoglycan-binding domain-containing M23 family metallopeptidase n=1 Tax=Pseudoruegeria sp. SK021 TaxID=1933035 RepID=UPI000A23F86A|nr:LysM peptidoglycan-binding domain-containing M23 family metallopeptidase [Pseudoruegeria sp. SK021]OSP54478.1 hypothetical protein BV911_12135 [Pseudoruegeria sp. SK021]